MATERAAAPPAVSAPEWLTHHRVLLEHEKELTKHLDRVKAERRRLPMVRVDKRYVFKGPDGSVSLLYLCRGRRQLIVYRSTYGRGTETRTGFVSTARSNALRRQESFKDSPARWPQKPTHG
jgi:predicted dithiol-disulfide oxidoreductase (DUF899 family)